MSVVNRRWVVVSGAAGSLGRGCVTHYALRGPVLALDLVADTEFDSSNVTYVAVDLTSPEAMDSALARIPSSEEISLLVNAVGKIWNEPVFSIRGARMVAHDVVKFRETIDANLTAAFVVSSRVAARMARKGRGAIVNFSSISAEGVAGQVAYSAAKAGVAGMTKAMAVELGHLGIRVNAVSPGFIDVPSTRAALSDSKLAEYISRTPSRRLGALSELIAAVDFLSSNSFVNGSVLEIDGGFKS